MKYILYCRKSTDTEDRQVLSLDSQEKELVDLAEYQGLQISKVLRESQSAKAEGRPVFDSLLRELQSGKADAILCWKLDRLARNMVDAGRVMDMLQRGVIKEIRTHDAVHLPTDNVLMLAVQLGMANQYIRDLSENVKRGNRTKLEQGGWPNKAPFGYRNDLATKGLVVYDEERAVIVRAFDLFATGRYALNEVRKMLNSEGFRTASGTELNKSLIERIIKNPFYMGVMLSHGKYYAGNHETIVSKALYDQAQAVLNGTTRPKSQTLSFPLRGILRCATCTCQYTASLKKGHAYYYCTNGKGSCGAHARYLRSEPATELVADALGKVRIDRELIEIMADAKREMYADAYSYTEAIQKRLKGQIEALERDEVKLFEDSSAGIIGKDFYTRQMLVTKNKKMLFQKDLKDLKLQNGLSTLEPIKDAFIRGNTAQNRFLNADPEQQKIVAAEVLWNLLVKDGETEAVRYRSYYEVLAKAPKSASLEIMLGD